MYFIIFCCALYQISAANDASKDNSKLNKHVSINNGVLNEIKDDVMNIKPKMLKGYKDKDESIHYELNKVSKNALNTKMYSRKKHKYRAIFQKYEKYAIRRGSERFRDIPYYMSIELHIPKETLPSIHNVIKNFTKKSREFFREIYNEHFSTDTNKEFSLLDTVQIFNAFVYGEQLALLHNMILPQNDNISTDKVMIILKHFYNEFFNNKRADTEYACVKFEICRPTMRFTDYIDDIARDLMRLSDAKLTEILQTLSVHIKDESEFFQLILGKSTARQIGMTLEHLIIRDVTGIRIIFVCMRLYLAKRHKLTQNSDEKINIRSKALRVLMDIIDQTFDINGDEILGMHFNMILKTIADWSEGRKNEIEKVLKTFVVQAVGVMRTNLSDNAISEIKALVNILLEKEDRSNKYYQALLKNGSTFVRGEVIPTKISLLT